MGFFSSLKRLWSSDEKASSPEGASAEALSEKDLSIEATPAASQLTETLSTEPLAAAQETTLRDGDSEPERSETEEGQKRIVPSEAVMIAAVSEVCSGTPVGFDRDEMLLRLREAEPRLSIWLTLILGEVAEAGEPLWERIRFLLLALGAPQEEADTFTRDFADWAERMEYREVQDFRSELQYRLALALDLEDEEDERSRLFLKLHAGLARTREQLGKGLSALFSSHGALDDAFWEELEEVFIMADMGVEAAMSLCKRLKERARTAHATTPEELRPLLAEELETIFRIPRRVVEVNKPEVILVIGVNGVGKTTTIAKLAYRARMQGKKVLLAAADTFRAAAVEQLGIWAERTGSGFHSKGANADPAAVAWEALEIAQTQGYDCIFIDTAGRLHTKSNLMDELAKIRNTITRKHPGAPHRSILVVDATTGQNALQQTKIFKEAAGIDEIILTKLDGTAKGGVTVAVAMQFGIPITYVGLGEKMEDLRPFDGDDFAKALLSE